MEGILSIDLLAGIIWSYSKIQKFQFQIKKASQSKFKRTSFDGLSALVSRC